MVAVGGLADDAGSDDVVPPVVVVVGNAFVGAAGSVCTAFGRKIAKIKR